MENENMVTNKLPLHINYFLYVFFGSVLITLIELFLENIGVGKQISEAESFKNYAIGTCITLIFIWFIYKRKNWARIVFTVLTIINIFILILIIQFEIYIDLVGAVSSIIQVILGLAVIYFLFTKQSSEWFKKKKVEQAW